MNSFEKNSNTAPTRGAMPIMRTTDVTATDLNTDIQNDSYVKPTVREA